MALETRLASAHWDRVRSRDAVATYTLLDRTALQELTPGLDWDAWLEGVEAPASVLDEVVVRQPDFLAALAQALDAVPIGDWGLWLAWRVLSGSAPYLSDDVADESFAFYGRTLTGAPEQQERWKRGIDTVESALGEAVGQLYVERHFPPEAKERMTTLVANLVEAYRRNIAQLDWMSAETKARAQDKLARFTPKIGYPDQWRDYSALQVDPDDLLGNVRAGAAFETDRELAKLGGPVDRDRVAHDPADGQRLLQPRHERDRLPRRHPAAAVLRPRGRGRGQLRRDRRGHRPRDRPRVRRPGLAVRRPGQPQRLVDRAGPCAVRRADPGRSSTSTTRSNRATSPAAT